jgi:hypothetical protein
MHLIVPWAELTALVEPPMNVEYRRSTRSSAW